MEEKQLIHELDPIYNKESKVLILGSFPSVKSREKNFYYGYKYNRFWQVLEEVFDEKMENNNKSKTEFVLKHKLALYDVIDSCIIKGSSDSSIRNVEPTDLSKIISSSNISCVILNGGTAYKLYKKYQHNGLEAILLPSTSPANARYRLDDLVNEWEIIKEKTKGE